MGQSSEETPDTGRVHERARERQRERVSRVEAICGRVGALLDEPKYLVSSEDLAVTYSETMLDLPNETESLGDVFDRLVDERHESPVEAREAVVSELTGLERGPNEYNDERALSEVVNDETDHSRPECHPQRPHDLATVPSTEQTTANRLLQPQDPPASRIDTEVIGAIFP